MIRDTAAVALPFEAPFRGGGGVSYPLSLKFNKRLSLITKLTEGAIVLIIPKTI